MILVEDEVSQDPAWQRNHVSSIPHSSLDLDPLLKIASSHLFLCKAEQY